MARVWRRTVVTIFAVTVLGCAWVTGVSGQPADGETEAVSKPSAKKWQDPAAAQRAVEAAAKQLQDGQAEQASNALSATLAGGNLPPPIMAKALMIRGMAYRHQGQHAQAISDLTSALWLKGGLVEDDRAEAGREREAAYKAAGLRAPGDAESPAPRTASSSGDRFSNMFVLGSSIIAWTIVLLSGCFVAFFPRTGAQGWRIANGLVLLGSLLALWLVPQAAGAVAAFLFALFIVVPIALVKQANLAWQRGQWQNAARLFRWAAHMHPAPWLRFKAAVIAFGPSGAAAALTEIEASGSRKQKALARLRLAYERRDWNDVIALLPAADAHFTEIIPMKIRALGELGRLDEMVQAYGKAANWIPPEHRMACMLPVLAFTGRVELVKQVLQHRLLAAIDTDSRTYWMTVARLRRDIHDWAALAVLRGLSETGTDGVRRSAAWRLQQANHGPDVSLTLSEDSVRTLRDMGPDGELRSPWHQNTPPLKWRWLWVVLLLIAFVAVLQRYLGW